MRLAHQSDRAAPVAASTAEAERAPARGKGRSNADQIERLKAARPHKTDGLHAGGCGCARCQGGTFGGVDPNFTHIGPEGEALAGDPAQAPAMDGPEAGSLAGSGEAAQAGAVRAGRHPDFPQVYGQTWYNVAELPSAPRVRYVEESSSMPWSLGWTVKVVPVAAPAAPTWPVLVTPANAEGYKVNMPHPSYPDLEHYVVVSEQAASNVAACEDQHVQDLDQGWALAAGRLAEGINYAAGAEDGFQADTLAAAKEQAANAIISGMGSYGAAIKDAVISGGSMEAPVQAAMNKAFHASKTHRDAAGKHSFPLLLKTVDEQKGRVASAVKDDGGVDGTASGALVNLETIA